MPASSLQHVASLYKLGGGIYKQGLTRRPELLQQPATIHCVHQYLREHLSGGKTRFTSIPTIPTMPPVFEPLVAAPEGDSKRAREARYHQRRRFLAQRHRDD